MYIIYEHRYISICRRVSSINSSYFIRLIIIEQKIITRRVDIRYWFISVIHVCKIVNVKIIKTIIYIYKSILD